MRMIRRVPLAVLWIIPALLVIEAINANRPSLMWIEWTTTLDVVNGSYVLLAPLCAGMSCALAVPVARRWNMVRSMPDGGLRALVVPTALAAAVFGAVHLLAIVTVVVIGRTKGIEGWPNILPALSVVAVFGASAAVGTSLGRVSESLIAAPFSVLLVYGYQIFEPRIGDRLFSDFGGATVLLLGLKHRPEVVVWQTIWLVAVAALLVSVACWGRRVASSLLGAAALVLLVFASTVGVMNGPETRFTTAAVTWVCQGETPQVCVVKEYEKDLPSYAARVGAYANALSELGAPVPDVFRQAVGAAFPQGGAFSIGPSNNNEQLVSQIIQSTYPCSQEWSEIELNKSDVIVSYLIGGEGNVLYPGASPATRESSSAAAGALKCS